MDLRLPGMNALLHGWQDTYADLSIEDITRSVFSMGVLIGWRAAKS
jgi:hypothetical protein